MNDTKLSADGIYDYASDKVDVPSELSDKLAHTVITRFNEAARWQGMEHVGNKSLRVVLKECYEQYNGILSCRDREIVEELGVDAYVNLTAMKSGIVQAYLLETLVSSKQLPWVIEPTPISELSEEDEASVAEMVLSHLELDPSITPDNLQEFTRSMKAEFLRKSNEVAKRKANNMEQLIIDQCLEGGWNNAITQFTSDFTVYPFAVLQGPVPIVKNVPVWSGDKYTIKQKIVYDFQAVSPWDFWYTADSPDTQRGTGVFVRQRWTRMQLINAMRMPSYNAENITKVLDETTRDDFIFRWLSENPIQPDERLLLWRNCISTVDVLIHYGFFKGSELRDYGITDIEDDGFYNAQVTVVGKHTIQVVVHRSLGLNLRPVFTSSFYKTQDRIPSFSIAQRLRDVERAYIATLRYLMVNAYNVSGPIVEADYTRLAKYLSSEDLNKVIPNTIYMSSSEVPTANPALRFYTVPSAIPQYQSLMSFFMDLADRVTNIPAALHGTAVGSGANRTFRGAAMLQGNAVKAIQDSVSNIDQFIFKPMGELLYNYNMTYSDDLSVKGDCKIIACGATGLLQREIDRQNSYEILQLVGSAGQQIAQMPKGAEIITWALQNVLKNMGVPDNLLEANRGPAMAETQAQEVQAGMQSLSSGDALATQST